MDDPWVASLAALRTTDGTRFSFIRWREAGWPTLNRRAALYDLLAILAASLVVVVCLVYAEWYGVFDSTMFLVGVLVPVILGSAIISIRRDRIILFVFLAYIWAVLDDAPVFLDSLLTWPQVTRFHPFLPRVFMNIVIHGLTAFFMYFAIREAMKGKNTSLRNAPLVVILAVAAFVLAYAQNIPLGVIQNAVTAAWFPFDIAEKLSSIFLFYLAVREASKLKAGPSTRLNEKSA
jgi:hypothetical protein